MRTSNIKHQTSKIITTVAFAFLFLYSFGQETLPREQEREIKMSGKYYFGEGTSFDEAEAKKIALNQLTQAVVVSLVQQSIKSEIPKEQLQTLEMQAKTAQLALTGRIRILAWISKESIQITSNGAIVFQPETNPETDKIVPDAIPPKEETAKVEPPKEEQTKIEPPKEEPAKVEPANIEETSSKLVDTHPFIQDLVKSGTNTYSKFTGKVNDWRKKQGIEVVHGRKSSFSFPDKCYIAVFDTSKTKTLIALLDAGNYQSRTDLLTGNTIQNPEQHYRGNDIRWIEIR